ncbi:MAG: DUF5063 domain-containing protein, partial [Paludibacter sp.]
LPLMYLKTTLLDVSESTADDNVERFVSEEDYIFVKEQIEQLLGAEDSFLEVFHPDMALSDTPIAAFISENLADVYQEMKDFAANYQLGDVEIMNNALVACLEAFGEHWGQKLLNALRALHALQFNAEFMLEDTEVEPTETKNKIDRNSFLNFLHNEEDDDLSNIL